MDWLKENLGERLVGVNFWSLDRMLIQMPELFRAVAKLKVDTAEQPEPGVEEMPLAVWAQAMDEWARAQGYAGPRPRVSV